MTIEFGILNSLVFENQSIKIPNSFQSILKNHFQYNFLFFGISRHCPIILPFYQDHYNRLTRNQEKKPKGLRLVDKRAHWMLKKSKQTKKRIYEPNVVYWFLLV